MLYTLELIERKNFAHKIIDDLEQISSLLNILQKEQVSLSVRLSRNIFCSYYSLLSPSSVWSESSSSRAKYSEFESSSKYSQGPAQWAVQNDANIKLFLKVLCRVKYLYYTISDKRQQRLTYQFEEFCQRRKDRKGNITSSSWTTIYFLNRLFRH